MEMMDWVLRDVVEAWNFVDLGPEDMVEKCLDSIEGV